MSPVARACRNIALIHWFNTRPIGLQLDVQKAYARHLGCSLDEVCVAGFIQDPDVLDWMELAYPAVRA